MVNSEMFQPPGVVHVTVLLVSLLDIKCCLKYSQLLLKLCDLLSSN